MKYYWTMPKQRPTKEMRGIVAFQECLTQCEYFFQKPPFTVVPHIAQRSQPPHSSIAFSLFSVFIIALSSFLCSSDDNIIAYRLGSRHGEWCDFIVLSSAYLAPEFLNGNALSCDKAIIAYRLGSRHGELIIGYFDEVCRFI